jgi:serine protease Do
VAQLQQGGKVNRGYLGVQIQPLTNDLADGLGLASANGALIDEAQGGTPAAKAGLQAGDVITEINGEEIGNARELSRRVAELKPGSEVEVTFWRKGHMQTARVELGALPSENTSQAESPEERGVQLGLRLAPAKTIPGAGSQGVAVINVDPSWLAAAAGISSGDVLLEVNGQPVSAPADVQARLAAARKEEKKTALLRIKGGEGTRFAVIAIPKTG